MSLDWSKYHPLFTKSEFDCKETGENGMKKEFMDKLYLLRKEYGKSMVIKSGFRSAKHSVEAVKSEPGSHNTGKACDVAVTGVNAYKLVEIAIRLGFTGIGIHKSFVHLDMADSRTIAPRPNIWPY